jgi:hypothetical protein
MGFALQAHRLAQATNAKFCGWVTPRKTHAWEGICGSGVDVHINVKFKNGSANPGSNPLGECPYLCTLKIDKVTDNFQFSPGGSSANHTNAFGKHSAAFGNVNGLLEAGNSVS